MACRYGHRWSSQFGDEPDGLIAAEWRDTLAGLSLQQIRQGLDADAQRGSDWPPSSAYFRALCLGTADDAVLPRDRRPGAAMYRPVARRSKRIESDATRAAAEREMEKMRKLLGASV